MCLISQSRRKMLKLLVDTGANIDARNIVGDAPLHKAALNGRAISADYLIRAGANVNIRRVSHRLELRLSRLSKTCLLLASDLPSYARKMRRLGGRRCCSKIPRSFLFLQSAFLELGCNLLASASCFDGCCATADECCCVHCHV